MKVYKIRNKTTGKWAPFSSYGQWVTEGGKVWWTLNHAKARLNRYGSKCELVEFELGEGKVIA